MISVLFYLASKKIMISATKTQERCIIVFGEKNRRSSSATKIRNRCFISSDAQTKHLQQPKFMITANAPFN